VANVVSCGFFFLRKFSYWFHLMNILLAKQGTKQSIRKWIHDTLTAMGTYMTVNLLTWTIHDIPSSTCIHKSYFSHSRVPRWYIDNMCVACVKPVCSLCRPLHDWRSCEWPSKATNICQFFNYKKKDARI
jgi:hypothetical protein